MDSAPLTNQNKIEFYFYLLAALPLWRGAHPLFAFIPLAFIDLLCSLPSSSANKFTSFHFSTSLTHLFFNLISSFALFTPQIK
jgi:hypothetical protein